ncbi:MAG: septum site-determining protein MinC [Anaerolineales bacterium]|nr:septum site-determining protein MinC [Anaerolineales bacterium]
MSKVPSLIDIKGIRDGLLVKLGDAAWANLQVELINAIDERRAFFKGARLVLDVGGQVLHVAELVALREMLSERGIFFWAVLSSSSTTEQTAQNLGLATRISKPRPSQVQHAPDAVMDAIALWLPRTLRSGTLVEFPGHVTVMGDVNPGAEIVASGSIVVWGRLRGVVHAGAQGDVNALVCALELTPTQLRIAGEIAVSPKRKGKVQPEIARLKDGILVAEPWQA